MVTQISLFGALRKYGENGQLELDLPGKCRVSEVRTLLKERLADQGADGAGAALVDRSAFADNVRVLQEDEVLQDGRQLALLPPVCGG